MSQPHNFTTNMNNNRFVPASSLSLSSSQHNNISSTNNNTTNRRSSFYANSAMMANNNSSSSMMGKQATTNVIPSSSQGSGTLLFSHANRRESFGAPSAGQSRFSTNSALGTSKLSSNSSISPPTNTSGGATISASSGVSGGIIMPSSASSVVSNNSGSSMTGMNNSTGNNNHNNNRNSLSGSFSQQSRKRNQAMLTHRSSTFHNILGTSQQMDDVLSPEESVSKGNPLDDAFMKENVELKKENDELKQQLQKLKAQMVEKEKEMVDKDDKLKRAQFTNKELTDCKHFIENMSLKLIELGVDPNTLKQHPASSLSYDLSNILLGSSLELDDSVKELESVLFKYSPLYSRTSTLMQMED